MTRRLTREEEYAILHGDREPSSPDVDTELRGAAYILESTSECWSCHKLIKVVALSASDVDSDDGDGAAVLIYVDRLPPDLLARLQAINPYYGRVESKTAQDSYLGNTCKHCGALQGDHYLVSEPDGPFFPIDDAGAAGVTVYEVALQAPVKVAAGTSRGGALEAMLRMGKRSEGPATDGAK